MSFNGSRPIRVLLIEDDPDDVFLVKEILRSPNGDPPAFKLECAATLEEGIEIITHGTAVDVVVLDLSLPDQNGMDTLVRVQSRAPDVPIVVLTALNDEARAIEALAKGAQDYLVKGHVNSALLSRTLRYAIERHRVRRELFSVSNELRSANERLGKLVLLDPLTELLNRRGLQDSHGQTWI
jgi:PleD family two-component response regulator